MSPGRKHLLVALASGVVLALLTKTIYDLFNGYAVIPTLTVHGRFFLSAALNELVQFIVLCIPAFIYGSVVRLRFPSIPRWVVLACAVPWVTLTLYGVTSSLLRFGWKLPHESTSYALLEALAPILVILSVPAGLWLSIARKGRSEAVAL